MTDHTQPSGDSHWDATRPVFPAVPDAPGAADAAEAAEAAGAPGAGGAPDAAGAAATPGAPWAPEAAGPSLPTPDAGAPGASGPGMAPPTVSARGARPRTRTAPIVWGALILVFCAYVAVRTAGGAIDVTLWLIGTIMGLGLLLLAVGIAVLLRGHPGDD